MNQRGFGLMPAIGAVSFVIIFVAGYFAVRTLSPVSAVPAPLTEQSTTTNTAALRTAVSGTIDPRDIESVLFTVGAAPSVRVTVDTPTAGVVVKVTDPKGGTYSAIANTGNADSKEGERYIIERKPDGTYRITIIAPGGTTPGEYRVTVENPSGSSPAPYTVDIPDAPVVVTDTQNVGGSSANIEVSITVGETIALSGFVAIADAQVIATITAPSGTQTSLLLAEEEGSLGTYSGTFNGATESGTYSVEYVIQGENSAEDEFYKTSYDQFTVAGGTVTGSGGVNKKFDINRGDEIQLIGY
ncbi:MAG TPA: hypothetical protein DCZ84_00065 [Candidatus Vogelbacteria bacterium]|uniref:Uncharacterized protein n=1 Tax=Candidatus Vogelbacteria bacterium RIFOXYD1_FULL_51_18 TaxID=1802440 RepID=A0A1G2QKI7_9BACT|nr:MAG: hypothetical protein A2569_00805 [Candidatus Vogelbacteria bacterium RIFOXYD1_FULL_51_18]HBB65035.1 hypothetical protein [Candidatus Vogelbacteria bacterium]HBC44201.1 hypothetical protein [Candidatus Vogelbacteria bacterium]